MSYILDALRKSDQLRQRNSAPTLMLGNAAAVAPRQPAPVFYGVLAVVLLGAGILIGWLRPWQSESANDSAVRASVPVPKPAAGAAPRTQPDQQSKPAPAATSPELAAARASLPARSAEPAQLPPAMPEASARASATPPATPQPAAPHAAAQLGGGAVGDSASIAAVLDMADLPVSIQQELPAMSISVHAYSDRPGERLVGINNRLLHEGDEVAPGLKLVQITPKGMLLSYKGYNFRRGVR